MNPGETSKPIVDRRGFKRTVPMQVLCLGMSRSGTDSLARALTILGIPTYHGYNVTWNHWDALLWQEATYSKWYSKGKVWGREDFDQLLGDYSACADFPAAGFPLELIQAYPEAQVILNKRPFDKWYESYLKAFQIPLIENWKLAWFMRLDSESRTIWNFWLWFLEDVYFRGSWRRNARTVYDEHTAVVRGAAPKGRFLEWDVTQGWGPLCEFLDKPVPDEPFPSGNKVDELLARIIEQAMGPRVARITRRLKVLGATLVVVSGVLITKYLQPGLYQRAVSSLANSLGRLQIK